jgi:hypothetical protein
VSPVLLLMVSAGALEWHRLIGVVDGIVIRLQLLQHLKRVEDREVNLIGAALDDLEFRDYPSSDPRHDHAVGDPASRTRKASAW